MTISILGVLFSIFIFALVFVLFIVIFGLVSLRQFIDRIQGQVKQMQGGGFGNNSTRSRSGMSKEGVVDTRPQEERQQKIFKKDEGEYVDYEES